MSMTWHTLRRLFLLVSLIIEKRIISQLQNPKVISRANVLDCRSLKLAPYGSCEITGLTLGTPVTSEDKNYQQNVFRKLSTNLHLSSCNVKASLQKKVSFMKKSILCSFLQLAFRDSFCIFLNSYFKIWVDFMKYVYTLSG